MATRSSDTTLSPAVAKLQRGLVLRSKSVLITVYGDAIAPRNQAVWLGSLISVGQMFGLSSRLVRTSAARLTADDWFDSTKIGRRSYYKLSPSGLLRVQHADRRIYEFSLPQWDGRWTLVILDSAIRATRRAHLKRELLWESFGQLAPGVFAHPHVNHGSLRDILEVTQAGPHAAVLSAESLDAYSREPLENLLRDTFDLEKVEAAWKQFIARFSAAVNELRDLTPAESFFVRTLLIHEYRRVLLRDPNLPSSFLPPDWPGLHARRLCESIYRKLLPASEQFLLAHIETSDGRLVETPTAIFNRIPGSLQRVR